jgi:hypothetical protein
MSIFKTNWILMNENNRKKMAAISKIICCTFLYKLIVNFMRAHLLETYFWKFIGHQRQYGKICLKRPYTRKHVTFDVKDLKRSFVPTNFN